MIDLTELTFTARNSMKKFGLLPPGYHNIENQSEMKWRNCPGDQGMSLTLSHCWLTNEARLLS